MKQFLTLLFLLVGLGASPAAAQQGYVTISGYIEDVTSHEALIGASVYAPALGQGTMSNSQGFYSLRLPVGTHELSARYIGYAPYSLRIQLERDTTLRLQLHPTGQLEDVVITAERQRLNLDKLGVLQAPVHILKKVPSLLGEADLMKALQLMPGVQSGSDGSAGVHVRGGGSDENLILLDGAPLYNVDHLMGFFSVFTPEAVKTVDLYKGSFPARYGGRLSSVIDVRTKDGDL
ncbi:TonB-dependent receptor, partial [Porphyromonas sp.]